MSRLAQTESRSQFLPALSKTIEIPDANGNLYRTLQLEVELGAQVEVTGRGKSGLSQPQQDRIRRLAGYHPSTDFGRIGL